ncbi:MAG: hypothetical protein JSS86_21900, partial [Cyanobacteria bacterium SZAS LIN-2]|nr:hypothetical protein [Cyanobacteria bacterium SZAS LIN-2]
MVNSYEPVTSAYTSRQRVVCATLGLASSISVSTSAAMANVPVPTPHAAPSAWPSHMTVPAGHAFSANAAGWQSAAGAGGHSPFGSFGSANTQATQNGALSNFHVQHAVNHAFLGAAAASANSNDLNLASSKQTFLADNLANFHDLTILVGGTREVITSGSRLTAAEVVAAQQVLTGGTQTIRLNSSGTAIGGTVTLNNNLLTALDSSVGGSIGSLT